MDNQDECCDGVCNCKCAEPTLAELERQLEKSECTIVYKDNLIEGLQRAIVTSTCRIRDLETDREYWRNRYYAENERTNKLAKELAAFKEDKN